MLYGDSEGDIEILSPHSNLHSNHRHKARGEYIFLGRINLKKLKKKPKNSFLKEKKYYPESETDLPL